MLVILQRNIKKLGIRGAVVKVKAGHARNYLIPQKEAIPATKESLAELEKNRQMLDEENIKFLEQAKKLAESAASISLLLFRKANRVDGKLFGSILVRDLLPELEKHEVKVSPKDIVLPQIKYVGDYQVEVVLHPEVVLKLPLSVKAAEDDTKV